MLIDLDKQAASLRMKIKKQQNDEVKEIIKVVGIDRRIRDLGTSLSVACIFDNTEIATYCIENGADVNVRDSSSDTPLIASCKAGNFELVKLLIENGAEINARNKYDKTPISRALSGHSENYELIKYLLEKGADPFIEENYTGDDPRVNIYTAYDYAKESIEDEKLIELLERYKK